MANTQNTQALSSLVRGVGPGGFVGVDLANEVMTGTILPAANLPTTPTFSGLVTVSGTSGIKFDNATADATVVSADHAVARTYTIPDCGAAASFVMTELAQTIAGTKTFTGSVVLTSATVVTPTVADVNVVGGIPVVHRIAVADGVTGNIDTVLTYKTRITDVVVIKTGGAGGASDTITVQNGATAITNAMDINVSDQVVVRAGTINDASYEIAAAGTLRVVRTKSSAANVACEVIVYGFRVA